MSERFRRAHLVPEVLQNSLMDCGPASLQSVLLGHHIQVDYDLIRNRCATDVDGTSIQALSKLGSELGLATSQVLVSRDSLLLPSADCLPAIAITYEGSGGNHFVVIWNVVGPFVQVMDPGIGRSWQRRERFLERLPDIPIPVSAARFAAWRKTRYARAPLLQRLRRLGLRDRAVEGQLELACRQPDFRPYAALDAATRMVEELAAIGAIARGREAENLHSSLLAEPSEESIPRNFWWATPGRTASEVVVRGAPIVRFKPAAAATAPAAKARRPARFLRRRAQPNAATAESDLAVAAPPSAWAAPFRAHLQRHRLAPARLFLCMLGVEQPRALWLLSGALLLAALVALVDVVLLHGLLHTSQHLALTEQRVFAVGSLLVLCVGGLALDWGLVALVGVLGRRLELRVRAALFEQLPRLPDAYLRTRSTADMAQRGHALHLLRQVPEVARRILESGCALLASAAALVALYPAAAPLTLTAAGLTFAIPWLLSGPAAERMLRARTHLVALDNFYLDALTGVLPVRVHNAETAVRREHESRLVEWARASEQVHAQSTLMQGAQLGLGLVLALSLVVAYTQTGGPLAALLLLLYFAQRMPAAGSELVNGLVVYRALSHVAVRFFAPLAQPVGSVSACARSDGPAATPTGVEIRFDQLRVTIAGRDLFRAPELHVPRGQHVSIVGASGAGKSTLVSLLLGWYRPAAGSILVDGQPLDPEHLARLRSETAWIDPAVQLWNDSLLQNVLYGAGADAVSRLATVLETAHLGEVLEALPDGLQTRLGENGTKVSGGQGQRVRLARGLTRHAARLVILDEPFRGLQRSKRKELLGLLRAHFRGVTLLFVSHDIEDTLDFDRVWVVDRGEVVEDGEPRALVEQPDSRYASMLAADRERFDSTWNRGTWRALQMEDGQIRSRPC